MTSNQICKQSFHHWRKRMMTKSTILGATRSRVTGISEEGDKEIYGDIIDTLNEKLPVLPQLLSRNEIDRLHRTGKSSADGKPRPVLIKFTSYQHRLNLMNNQAALMRTNIFLNEELTRKNSLLWSWCGLTSYPARLFNALYLYSKWGYCEMELLGLIEVLESSSKFKDALHELLHNCGNMDHALSTNADGPFGGWEKTVMIILVCSVTYKEEDKKPTVILQNLVTTNLGMAVSNFVARSVIDSGNYTYRIRPKHPNEKDIKCIASTVSNNNDCDKKERKLLFYSTPTLIFSHLSVLVWITLWKSRSIRLVS
ncbi:hypothetical protein CAPTEDRAFT_192280 [Capitella teleta]|uniref:Uncharacterized protein n=1 Tax=Capitella teleta TaxID=283909 RepID=R7UAE2_CAPTE|nr:hypothetical protein CAPTEDRAFT_192280 [Capitella teleta]|eukprot:ELU03091.1 hypothetical protein CAPTEDRAFT_192280 [Capitella teleta]